MEHGLRFPSDKVLLDIAERLGEDPENLFLAAYCDRSSHLAEVLKERGIAIPEPEGESTETVRESDSSPALEAKPAPLATPPAQVIRAHDPF